MSSTVDANVLLYASDRSSPRYTDTTRLLTALAGGPDLVYIFWPVAMAYLRIATHPAIFDHPMDPANAQANLDQLLSRPHVRSPGEDPGFWAVYLNTVEHDVVRGSLVTDAHIASLMRQHGISRIWTYDRDFRRFPEITPLDPATWDS